MKTIQKLFDRLAGVTQGELDRIGLAAEIFGAEPSIDIAVLEKPACWRRPPRYLNPPAARAGIGLGASRLSMAAASAKR